MDINLYLIKCIVIPPMLRIYIHLPWWISGVLSLSCAVDLFQSLGKPTDPVSGKCIYMHKIEMVRLIEFSKSPGSAETINYFVAYIRC